MTNIMNSSHVLEKNHLYVTSLDFFKIIAKTKVHVYIYLLNLSIL